uniref:D-xylose 1-dehydrogenase (NADP(+), D-xylono-1,5-lactone-forming) n=1 Tax=Timspurckia oligopyrenoides TaxID=708627 RepID=A0A7S0ZAH4_9RHOD|mmetsp:Transcript_10285/g.18527  ORF Transcript_10285/g.18527 Transcript_10285/m.18527 type:complete len:397 (+) Transcript_10285:102-1292(+)
MGDTSLFPVIESAQDVIPLDLRLGLTRPLDGNQILRWGICGAGRVCNDWVQSLKVVPGARITSVAARDPNRASKFAKLHGIPHVSNDYAELMHRSDVDIIYIGTVQSEHLAHALLALESGKHVLVEKPAGCNRDELKTMIETAKQHNRFFLEGVWTRFFPIVEYIRQILESNAIGSIVAMQSDFGFNSFEQEEYPSSPMYDKSLGGGALLYVGVYPISMIPFAFGNEKPCQVLATGYFDQKLQVDMNGAISAMYKDGRIATVMYGLTGETAEETTVVGSKGRIVIHTPAHCPLRMTVFRKKDGRGNVEPQTYEFPLPAIPQSVNETGGFVYPNSFGFQFEAAAVQRCIFAGLTECPQYTTDDSLLVAEIMESVRDQVTARQEEEHCNPHYLSEVPL